MIEDSVGLRIHRRGNSVDLVTAMVADYAQVAELGKINVMGIFSEIYAKTFPVTHQKMYLVIKLSAAPAEVGQKRTITIKLMDEDGQTVLMEMSTEREVREAKIPGARIAMQGIIEIHGIVFPAPGTYQFSIMVDNDEKGTLPLYVMQGGPPGQET